MSVELVGQAGVDRPVKVVIGIPSGDTVLADFAMSLVGLVLRSAMAGLQVAVVNQKSSIIEVGRNELAAQALALGGDYLLFLDTDMTFPPDTLIRMLQVRQPIVTCDAVRKRPPFTSCLTGMDDKPINYDDPELPKVVEVKGAATGVMLISAAALMGFGKNPPFQVVWNGECFIGEDYYFSREVRKHGYRIYCDTELSRVIGHIGTTAYMIGGRKNVTGDIKA